MTNAWFKTRAETDTRLVTTANGAIVGYAHVVNEAPHLIVTLGEFYRCGTHRVVTDTDKSSSTGANHLYPKAGFAVFRQEDVYEKEIRPGQDWVIRNPALK